MQKFPYEGCVFCCAGYIVDPTNLLSTDRYFGGIQIFGTLFSLPYKSRNSSVTCLGTSEKHMWVSSYLE